MGHQVGKMQGQLVQQQAQCFGKRDLRLMEGQVQDPEQAVGAGRYGEGDLDDSDRQGNQDRQVKWQLFPLAPQRKYGEQHKQNHGQPGIAQSHAHEKLPWAIEAEGTQEFAEVENKIDEQTQKKRKDRKKQHGRGEVGPAHFGND